MNNSVLERPISTMTEEMVNNVRKLESAILNLPQVKIPTSHLIHAGMYARTILVPAGVIITGSLMKIATILILSGDFIIYIDDNPIELHGYNIFAGNPNRKQAGVAITDTSVTMIFPTNVRTIAEAEEQFTDEANILFSRYPDAVNHIKITGT